jgi:hypothetical protein
MWIESKDNSPSHAKADIEPSKLNAKPFSRNGALELTLSVSLMELVSPTQVPSAPHPQPSAFPKVLPLPTAKLFCLLPKFWPLSRSADNQSFTKSNNRRQNIHLARKEEESMERRTSRRPSASQAHPLARDLQAPHLRRRRAHQNARDGTEAHDHRHGQL